MKISFSFYYEEEMPHCFLRHLIEPKEAIEAWYKGKDSEVETRNNTLSRQAIIKGGKDITVIWVWQEATRVFIITAYETDKEAYHEG